MNSSLIKYSITKWYYLVTPIFIVLDYVWGLNVRISIFDAFPFYKNLYYAVCMACGIGITVVPKFTPIVALIESTINVLLAILALLLPYYQFIAHADDLLNPDMHMIMFDGQSLMNIILAGCIAVLAFNQNSDEVERLIQKKLSDVIQHNRQAMD
jgi:hypothetical protein